MATKLIVSRASLEFFEWAEGGHQVIPVVELRDHSGWWDHDDSDLPADLVAAVDFGEGHTDEEYIKSVEGPDGIEGDPPNWAVFKLGEMLPPGEGHPLSVRVRCYASDDDSPLRLTARLYEGFVDIDNMGTPRSDDTYIDRGDPSYSLPLVPDTFTIAFSNVDYEGVEDWDDLYVLITAGIAWV